jgi:uncharacterized protein (TIGR03000 family)
MMNRFLLAPVILSIVGLLGGADSAFAQRGGGHGGGGHGGGGHVGGGHVGGGHGGNFGHHHGFYGGGYYPGFYGGGYYPGIFGGSYPWYDTYTYPSYSYYDAPALQYYYSPATEYYAPPAPVAADYANIRVIVPDPQGRVWFDGNRTSQTGTERLFSTPSLTMGSRYSYQIRASWMQGAREVSQERTVSVTPGQTTLVDFSQ